MSSGRALIPDNLQKTIDKILTDYDIEIIVIGNSNDGQPIVLTLIAKLAPTSKTYRDFFPIRKIYEREIFMYNAVIPEFVKLQKENNNKNVFAPFAKCYQSSLDEPHEALVLQDMKPLGYNLLNHRHPLDFHHAAIVLKTLAKFHALSFALRDRKPKLFKKLTARIHDHPCLSDRNIQLIKKLGSQVLKCLDSDDVSYKAFEKFIEDPSYVVHKIVRPESAGKYAVIMHGDSQTKNILFKYSNCQDPNVPTDLCVLDLQICCLGSPCLDICYFIWICTDKKLRDSHYHNLIDIYYNSFSCFLRELGSNPEESLPVDVFKEHLRFFSVLGVYAAIGALSRHLSDSKSMVDLLAADSIKSIFDILAVVPNIEYCNRIRDVVSDFISYGYKF